MGPKMKIAMTVMPFCMLPITVNFPMAVTFYWLTTNLVSLFQSQFLKIPIIRKGLNIPIMIKHPPPATTSPGAKKVHQNVLTEVFILLIYRDLWQGLGKAWII